jgi:hypothetical protein
VPFETIVRLHFVSLNCSENENSMNSLVRCTTYSRGSTNLLNAQYLFDLRVPNALSCRPSTDHVGSGVPSVRSFSIPRNDRTDPRKPPAKSSRSISPQYPRRESENW